MLSRVAFDRKLLPRHHNLECGELASSHRASVCILVVPHAHAHSMKSNPQQFAEAFEHDLVSSDSMARCQHKPAVLGRAMTD